MYFHKLKIKKVHCITLPHHQIFEFVSFLINFDLVNELVECQYKMPVFSLLTPIAMLLMSALFTTFQLLEIFNEEIFFERNLITF